MARRSDHSREELRDMALETAGRIVSEEGLRGLTARRIAREIGYTIGTLYNIFENLDDLIDQMNGRTLDRLYEVTSPPDTTGTPPARLRALADRYVGFAAANPRLYVTLFEHQYPAGRKPPDWYLGKVENLLGVVEAAIAPVMPGASETRVEAQARVLWAGVHGIISLEGAGRIGGSNQASDLIDLLLDNFLSALD